MFPPFVGEASPKELGGRGGITTFAKYLLINMNQPCQNGRPGAVWRDRQVQFPTTPSPSIAANASPGRKPNHGSLAGVKNKLVYTR